MRKTALLLFIALSAALFGGCIEIDTVVRVKADGSGTVEEKVLMGRVFVEQMTAMAEQMKAMGGSTEMPGADFNLVDEERLRARAAAMGEGVTLVESEPFSSESGEGYRATYAFTDVSKLRVNQNPGDAVPAPTGDSPPSRELISFRFTPGSPATLAVTLPEEDAGEEAADMSDEEMPFEEGEFEGAEGGDEEMDEQAMEIFKSMRIAVAIEVDGEIVETNATHREGSRVTLMELDFGKLLENPEKFQALQGSEPGSIEEAKELMKDLPGIKVEMNRELEIRFK